MTRPWSILAGSLLLSVSTAPALVSAAQSPGESQVAALLAPSPDIGAVRAFGPEVLPVLAALYGRSDAARRTSIAWTLYSLGWKSEEAKRALMRDVHTDDTDLRLQVQWALGRVSNDPDVVETLVDNMRNDGNPLFR